MNNNNQNQKGIDVKNISTDSLIELYKMLMDIDYRKIGAKPNPKFITAIKIELRQRAIKNIIEDDEDIEE